MRVNLDTEKCYNYTIFLDGIKAEYCIEADDVEGYVICHVVDDKSMCIPDDEGNAMTSKTYGRVLIEYKESETECL